MRVRFPGGANTWGDFQEKWQRKNLTLNKKKNAEVRTGANKRTNFRDFKNKRIKNSLSERMEFILGAESYEGYLNEKFRPPLLSEMSFGVYSLCVEWKINR